MRLLLPLLLLGCADVGSGSLFTSGMSAIIRGESTDGESTQITTVLRAGGPASTTFVKLEDDDNLTATDGDQSISLVEASLGALTSYRGTFSHADPEAVFTVSLNRTLDEGAPASTFSLPEPFTASSEQTDIDDPSNVEITWEPSGSEHQLVLEVDGNCITGGVRNLDGDAGLVTIPESFLNFLGEQPGVSCPVEARIAKVRGGSLDGGFGEGGRAQGAQVRAVEFTINWQ